MGTCLSKKSVCATSSPVAVPNPQEKPKSETQEHSVVKKEIFIIKHRTSHEIERQRSDEEKGEPNKTEESAGRPEVAGSSGDAPSNANGKVVLGGAAVRASSCTKEEVDAILIQCGRLSRSSSAALPPENGGRKFSGSKRSYDFDKEAGKSDGNNGDDERDNRRRERNRHSPGRRRTPSRERDREQARSGSRERTGNGGRRVSRSPGRRSESPITTRPTSDPNPNPNSKPGKMVSVPATVPPSTLDPNAPVKRIQVKRNATSPRARSPGRTRAANEPISLSRSNSRKAENSPYRRNPLGEIDTNIISQVPIQKPNGENRSSCTIPDTANCRKNPIEEVKGQTFVISENVAMNVIPQENQKPQPVTRSRSSRLSRDLDNIINSDNISSSSSSYTALLLEDIQNFHQNKNTNNPPAATTAAAPFTLPACVTKAQSILEAVADLNSTTEQMKRMGDSNKASKIRHHQILESELVGNEDNLIEPSFHKYVTVRRGTDEDLEEQQEESSGSNSLQQQQWVSSSCWEPNSAESTDRWTCSSSSRAVSKQSAAMSESGGDGGKRVTAKKRDCSDHQNGIGRGRIGTRGIHAAAMSTMS